MANLPIGFPDAVPCICQVAYAEELAVHKLPSVTSSGSLADAHLTRRINLQGLLSASGYSKHPLEERVMMEVCTHMLMLHAGAICS